MSGCVARVIPAISWACVDELFGPVACRNLSEVAGSVPLRPTSSGGREMTETIYQDRAWGILRLVYGLVPLLAGLDKFFNLLANWEQYLSPMVAQALPVSVPV